MGDANSIVVKVGHGDPLGIYTTNGYYRKKKRVGTRFFSTRFFLKIFFVFDLAEIFRVAASRRDKHVRT